MFPSIAQNLELQLQNMQTAETTELKPVGRSLAFDFNKNEFVFANGKNVETTELQAIQQWIELCLRTYKDKYNIYKDENFGVNIEDLIGQKPSPFVKAELDREIREGLKKSEQIQDIIETNYTFKGGMIIIDIDVKLKNNSILKVVV